MGIESGPKTPDAAAAAEALRSIGLEIDPAHPNFVAFIEAAKAGRFSENLESVDKIELISRLDAALEATRDKDGYINPDDEGAQRFVQELERRNILPSSIRAGYNFNEYIMGRDYINRNSIIDNARSGTFSGVLRIGLTSADESISRPAEVRIFA